MCQKWEEILWVSIENHWEGGLFHSFPKETFFIERREKPNSDWHALFIAFLFSFLFRKSAPLFYNHEWERDA